jgi:hypothetical protein
MKINYLGAFFGLILILGIFGPWLSKGSEPYGGLNPKTGKVELKYHRIIYLSPLYAAKIIDGNLIERAWFVSFGLSISAILLILSAILFMIRFKRLPYNFVSFLVSFFGFSMFFLSIGRGQAIGVITNLEWGVYVSFFSAFFRFISYVYELLQNPSI